jgi:hypothetical protein
LKLLDVPGAYRVFTAGALDKHSALPRPVRSMVEAQHCGFEEKLKSTLAKDDSASRSAKSTT